MPETGPSPPPGFRSRARQAESPSSAANPSGPRPQADAEKAGPDAFKEAFGRLAEAREYVAYLATAELDRFKLKVRRALMWTAAGIVALVLLLTVLVSAAFLLLAGVAAAIGNLLGHLWIGNVIVGGGILLLAVAGIWLGLNRWQASAFKSIKKRYEDRKRRERADFGHSVDPANDV